jgi:NAD(P)-dependent dehydrogenase (short-subunit alcohol dehydrogenase family)
MEDISLWKDLFSLAGKVALVTGGTRGLGKEIANTLARSGARVAVCSRNAEESTVFKTDGEEILNLNGDVADFESISRVVAATRERLGSIEILVANAGTNIRKSVDEMTLEEWDRVLSLNLRSAFLIARAVLPEMKERSYGRVVFIGSIHSYISLPRNTAYAASKAGLLGLTRALALEYAPFGVSVNCLCPGFIKTDLTSPLHQNAATRNLIEEKTPFARWGETKDIRGAILLLCSPAAAFMTGTSLVVDGGWTTQ